MEDHGCLWPQVLIANYLPSYPKSLKEVLTGWCWGHQDTGHEEEGYQEDGRGRWEDEWRRARKQPYFLSQRNLGQALVKDSNYALGLQYDVSQSRHGENAQPICISEVSKICFFSVCLDEGKCVDPWSPDNIRVDYCTLPWAVGWLSRRTMGPFPLGVIHLVLAEGHMIFGFAKGGGDKTRRCLLTKRKPWQILQLWKGAWEKSERTTLHRSSKEKDPSVIYGPKILTARERGVSETRQNDNSSTSQRLRSDVSHLCPKAGKAHLCRLRPPSLSPSPPCSTLERKQWGRFDFTYGEWCDLWWLTRMTVSLCGQEDIKELGTAEEPAMENTDSIERAEEELEYSTQAP